jgi:23S rRNA (guanosine2251-2'-O)-methyltransferase
MIRGQVKNMIIYGKHPISVALSKGRKVSAFYALKGFDDPSIQPWFARVPVTWQDKPIHQEMFGKETQGIAAEVEDYVLKSLDDIQSTPLRVALLDGITDPHNFGAIIRSAEAFGLSALIIRKDRSVSITPAVVKASAGAIETVDIVQVTNIHQTILTLQKRNVFVYGLDGDGTVPLETLASSGPMAIVLGAEGDGLSALVKKTCDGLIRIPMTGQIESLNVSVAAAIAFHEMQKGR